MKILPDRVPTIDEARLLRPLKQKWEMGSETERRATRDLCDKGKLSTFRWNVFVRDKGHCRCCGIKVDRVITRQPDQAQVHHLYGRIGVFRYLEATAILLCRMCHERVTGKVNDRLQIIGTKFLTIEHQPRIDAREPVTFKKVA